MTTLASAGDTFISSGVPALDHILGGGFTPNRLYMVEGVPGSGKTTLGLQFLLAGAAGGESVLYITLSETEEEVRGIAVSHGWDLSGVQVMQVAPDRLLPSEQYTVFQADEIELSETTSSILAEVERRKPTRVVFDSLSELRLLAGGALRYRRQMMGLKQFFAGRQCTVLVLDDRTATAEDPQLQSLAHGIVALEQWHPPYGREQRRLRVVKYRGVAFIGGYHDFAIRRGGLAVFPRLVTYQSRPFEDGTFSSGVRELDELLGGGVDRGSSVLINGAPGTGKSTIAAVFAAAVTTRGGHAAMFLFDESVQTLKKRMAGLGQPLEPLLETGRLRIDAVDPTELSPGEFAHRLAGMAADGQADLIVIDSLNGYLNAMPDERYITSQLHEMLSCLGRLGTTTLMVGVQHGLIGPQMTSPVDASYLADTVLILRYFESLGRVRQAVSVLKKRSGAHERTIREFGIDSSGLRVGKPLRGFQGVLTGLPVYVGTEDPLLKDTD